MQTADYKKRKSGIQPKGLAQKTEVTSVTIVVPKRIFGIICKTPYRSDKSLQEVFLHETSVMLREKR